MLTSSARFCQTLKMKGALVRVFWELIFGQARSLFEFGHDRGEENHADENEAASWLVPVSAGLAVLILSQLLQVLVGHLEWQGLLVLLDDTLGSQCVGLKAPGQALCFSASLSWRFWCCCRMRSSLVADCFSSSGLCYPFLFFSPAESMPRSSHCILLVYHAQHYIHTILVAGTCSLAEVGMRLGTRNWLVGAFSEGVSCVVIFTDHLRGRFTGLSGPAASPRGLPGTSPDATSPSCFSVVITLQWHSSCPGSAPGSMWPSPTGGSRPFPLETILF